MGGVLENEDGGGRDALQDELLNEERSEGPTLQNSNTTKRTRARLGGRECSRS